MLNHDFYWLAGLLEGEGSFVFHQTATGRQFVISLVSVDRDTVERAAELLGGNCTGPYMNAKSTKPYWKVQMARRAEVLALVRRLRPIMSQRRQQQIDNLLAMDVLHPVRPRGPRRKEA